MRLIDGDECIAKIKSDIRLYGHEGVREGLHRATLYIKHTPTVDPVKHGQWIETDIPDYRCSCCGAVEDTHAPYCWMCGARMDEKPGGDEVDEKEEQKE